MTAPQEAHVTMYSQLIDDLNEFILNEPKDELTRARAIRNFESRVRDLKKIDIAFGFSAMGSLCCAKNDIEGVHRNHLASLQYRRDHLMHFNYAVSLSNCGDLIDAHAYAKVAYDIDPTDLGNLNLLIRLCAKMGDEKLLLRYASAWERLKGSPHELYLDYLASVQHSDEITAMCTAAGIDGLAEIWNTPEEDAAWAHLQ